MMIKPERIEKLLASEGFCLGWVSNTERRAVFVRRSSLQKLFEMIDIHCGGKRGEALPADVLVSVTRGRAAGDGERELLMELANTSRGYFMANTREEASRWEERMAAIAPGRAEALARAKGLDLLKRTESARAAAKKYMALMPEEPVFEYLEHQLEQRATPEQRVEAERLARWPGVMWIPGGDAVYHAATLAIVLHGSVVEGREKPFWGHDPLKDDRELMQRIQILVDLLTRPKEDGGRGLLLGNRASSGESSSGPAT